MIVALVHYSVW